MLTFKEILPTQPIATEAARMIQEYSWGLEYPVDAWSELKESDFIIGCFDDEKLVAVGSITRVASPDKIDNGLPWFADAVVLPEYRKQGIYTELYNRRMQYLQDHNEAVALTCTDNPLIEQFLLAHGWNLKRITNDESGGACMVFEIDLYDQLIPHKTK